MTAPHPWTVERIIKATGGRLKCGHRTAKFHGFSIDSRNISKDQCFVAIKGETHDGHSFIRQVVESGINGIVIDADKSTKLPEAN